MARIAIVGVGAIGSVAAASLAQTGRHEIVLCVRRPLPRLTVQSEKGSIEVTATVLTDPSQATPVDWVIIATKAYDAAGAAPWLERLRGKATPVAVLQNGVEHRERYAPYLPAEFLLPVMVDCPAERDRPGFVRKLGAMRLRSPSGAQGHAFIELFAGGDVEAAVTDDFTTVIWRKLCGNCAGIISSLLLQPSDIAHDESIAEAIRSLVRECVAVGRAEGAKLDDGVVEAVVQGYRGAPKGFLNSLHADRVAGRPMETDARNTVIVRLGKKHGIPAPCNQMAVALLDALVKPIAT